MDSRTALLVIDAQFGPLWETHRKEETLTVIRNVIAAAEERNAPIVYLQHEVPGSPLARGEFGWQFEPGITPRDQDIVIHKQAADSFHGTTLQDELSAHGVEHLVVVGARTEYCVDTTCRSAVSNGYDVTLIADGHTTGDGAIPAEMIIQHHNRNLSTIHAGERRITVVPLENFTWSDVRHI